MNPQSPKKILPNLPMAEFAESTIMNQEVPQDISKSLDFYRNRFNHKYKPNLDEIVDLESQYEKFYESVQQVVMSKQNQIYLFFGLEGNGKKTVVDYCVQRLQANSTRVLNIVVDARVYKTEKLFLEEFYRKLVKLEECDERIAMYYKGQNFLFSEIDSVIKDIKTFIIITVKNLCDLSKNTRQVLLYSLLDWIRTSNVRIVIVGLVQDLMFLDLLEKRVKSRLSFMSFNFFKYSFEELKQVIIRRIQSNPQDPSLNKKLVEAIDYKETQDFLRPFYLGQRTIEWFISLFNLYFCLQNGLELENVDNVQPILLQGLKNVVNMLEPEYHKELLGDLVHSAELIIMVVLKRLIEQARSPLNFMVILDEIKDLKRRTSNITAFNFSDKVLLKAYENLTNINFIKLEGNNEKGNKLENFDCVLNVHLDDLKDFIRENSANMPSFVVEWSRG